MAAVVFVEFRASGSVDGGLVNGVPVKRQTRTAVFTVDGVEVEREVPADVSDAAHPYAQALAAGLAVEVSLTNGPTFAEARTAAYASIGTLMDAYRAKGVDHPTLPGVKLDASREAENEWTKLDVKKGKLDVKKGKLPPSNPAWPLPVRSLDPAVGFTIANAAALDAITDALFAAGLERQAIEAQAKADVAAVADGDFTALQTVLANLVTTLGLP